jgi:eukaryotic-like serine/threonine-protein kinase
MSIPSGTRMGSYEIIASIGAGGMGEVYRARDIRLDRIVAIKLIRRDMSLHPEALRRFEREARLISSLTHPHICTLYDVGNEQGVEYLVMEYLQGETLAECILREGALEIKMALGIAIDIAEALDKAHRHGVIHRDLKPGNIMLSDNGTKLLDFGLAKSAEAVVTSSGDAAMAPTSDGYHSEAGLMLGTHFYMSPEQARGRAADERSDIWSLGVVLYQMLTGELPFDGPSRSDVIAQILLGQVPTLPLHGKGVPERVGEMLMKALAKPPDERYQTARDLLLDLKQFRQRLEARSELERMGGAASGTGLAVLDSDWSRADSSSSPPSSMTSSLEAMASPGGIGPESVRWIWLALLMACGGVLALLVNVWLGSAVVLAAIGLAVYPLVVRNDSIAVMPFTYSTADSALLRQVDKEYLAEGITESIINTLSQFSDLKVISRSSVYRYKHLQSDTQRMARELGVRNLLVGRIMQRGTALVISVELEDALRQEHLWGEQYERDIADLVRIPPDISGEVCRKLRPRWAKAEMAAQYPRNSAAYQAYLKGRFFWNKRTADDLHRAIQHFEEAISLEPQYSLAYAGVADCYLVLSVFGSSPGPKEAYSRARVAAEKALEYNPELAEAHVSMAVIKAGDDWDIQGAVKEFSHAIKSNPNYATAHQWYGEHLVCLRRDAVAVAEMKRAVELDPISTVTRTAYAMVLLQAGRSQEAADEAKKSAEMDRNFYLPHRVLRDAYIELGDWQRAIEEHGVATVLAGESADASGDRTQQLRHALEKDGVAGYWRARLQAAEERTASELPYDLAEAAPYWRACLHARVGDFDKALEALQRAVVERDYGVLYVRTQPAFRPIENDPRFIGILRQVGLIS